MKILQLEHKLVAWNRTSNNDRTLETVRPEDWRLGYQKRPELSCQAMSAADPADISEC